MRHSSSVDLICSRLRTNLSLGILSIEISFNTCSKDHGNAMILLAKIALITIRNMVPKVTLRQEPSEKHVVESLLKTP